MNKDTSYESCYWNKFYKDWELDIPSQFCVLAATEIPITHSVVEFGCGNGRDSLYFAEHNFNVVAMDLSFEAIRKDKLILSEKKGKTLRFVQGDVSNKKDIESAIEYARNISKFGSVVIYTRFFLHTLDNLQEEIFINTLCQNLTDNDQIYFEFRSLEDEKKEKIYEGHYRRYIDIQLLERKLRSKLKIKSLYLITGQGMAKYKQEDPFVSRIIIGL